MIKKKENIYILIWRAKVLCMILVRNSGTRCYERRRIRRNVDLATTGLEVKVQMYSSSPSPSASPSGLRLKQLFVFIQLIDQLIAKNNKIELIAILCSMHFMLSFLARILLGVSEVLLTILNNTSTCCLVLAKWAASNSPSAHTVPT